MKKSRFGVTLLKRCPSKRLLNLALTAMRLVVVGVGGSDADTKVAMKFYEAFYKWTKNHLKALSEIMDPLQEFSEVLLRRTIESHSAWCADMLRGFSLVDMAIQGRMGLWCHRIETIYERTLRETIDRD